MEKTPDLSIHGWALLNTLEAQIAVLNRAGDILAVNGSWVDFTVRNGGDPASSGVGVNYLEACSAGEPDEHSKAAIEGLTSVLDGSVPEFLMEYPCHSPGEQRWFRMRARPLRIEDWTGTIVIHADVTSKYRAEERWLREHRRFTSLIEHADALITVMDPNGIITYKSPAFESIVGVFGLEPDTGDVFNLLHDDDVEAFHQTLGATAALPSGDLRLEFRMRHGEGSWRWIEATFTNLLGDPDVNGIVVNSRNITERKAAEVVLAQQAESFSTLFHATAEAMLIHDGTNVLAANQAYGNMIQVQPDQMVGRPMLDFVAPGSRELVRERVRQGSETPYISTALRGDGSTFFAELLGRQIQYEGRALRLVSVRDVTQQLAEEAALRASEARQSLLLRLATAQRETSDPDRMLAMACEALGRNLNLHRVGFFEMKDDTSILVTACWTDGTLPALSGPLPIAGVAAAFAAEVRCGRLASNPPMGSTAATIHGDGNRAGIGIPLIRGGEWRAGLFIDHLGSREWSEDESDLARDVAEQTWDAVERGRAEAALRASEARFRALVQESEDILVVLNDNGGTRYASPALERILGNPVEIYANALRLDLVHPDERAAVERAWLTVRESRGEIRRVAYRTLDSEGNWLWMDASFTNLLHMPEVNGVVLHARDATEQKRLESQLRHLALHDPLTGLPNRTLLADRMEQALRQASQGEKRVGLLFLDLDYFKQVNDAFGHAAGDGVLRAVAARLQSITRVEETVARLGGDEFVILLPMIPDALPAIHRAEQVQAAIATPFQAHGREVTTGVTIGIAVSEPGLLQPEVLLRDGDAALYNAKRTGRGHYLVHESTMSGNAMRRWRLKNDVGEAADRGELVMHYQPIVALASGAVSGMEALLRWRHPVYGMVSPDEFIPLAEEAGQMVALGQWGLTQVCDVLARWGADSLPISLNFSATQFSDPNLVSDVAAELARTGIDPRTLRLEITEQVVIEDLAGTVSTLRQLRELGVGVAIDDFGAGYSSLRYLRELPVTDIKLDRLFLHGLETDPGALAMITGIITLAHAIGLPVTAEGIETAGQLALLRGIDCDYAQGFHLGRPGPAPADPASRIEITNLRTV